MVLDPEHNVVSGIHVTDNQLDSFIAKQIAMFVQKSQCKHKESKAFEDTLF